MAAGSRLTVMIADTYTPSNTENDQKSGYQSE